MPFLELLVVDPGHLHLDIDAVEQGAREAGAVALYRGGAAAAHVKRVVQEAAGAGIGRGHEHEIGGVGEGCRHPRHGDHPVFQRLAQGLEDVAAVFRQLVEEKDAAVSQAYFTRTGHFAPADYAGGGSAVVGAAEGTARHQGAVRRQPAGNAVNARYLENFLEARRRQDARQAAGEHRFPTARRPV